MNVWWFFDIYGLGEFKASYTDIQGQFWYQPRSEVSVHQETRPVDCGYGVQPWVCAICTWEMRLK